jgi:hypothetical protein
VDFHTQNNTINVVNGGSEQMADWSTLLAFAIVKEINLVRPKLFKPEFPLPPPSKNSDFKVFDENGYNLFSQVVVN